MGWMVLRGRAQRATIRSCPKRLQQPFVLSLSKYEHARGTHHVIRWSRIIHTQEHTASRQRSGRHRAHPFRQRHGRSGLSLCHHRSWSKLRIALTHGAGNSKGNARRRLQRGRNLNQRRRDRGRFRHSGTYRTSGYVFGRALLRATVARAWTRDGKRSSGSRASALGSG